MLQDNNDFCNHLALKNLGVANNESRMIYVIPVSDRLKP